MKVLLTATMQSHICQFHLPLIKMLKENGCTVDVAANNNLDVKPGLMLDCADDIYDVPFARSPFRMTNLRAYKKMKDIINNGNYDIIHCNTPMGACITRLAAKKLRKKGTKVIYTAHGFHFYKGAPLKNWVMYYPMEWLLSFITDILICINTEDFELAKRHFHAKTTQYVKGVGFDTDRCIRTNSKKEARSELGIPENAKVLFSIGELNKRKNHQVIIEALNKIKDKDIYWYIAGNGPLEGELKETVRKYGFDENIIFLGYTRNITRYFEAADLFVFPSLQEGLTIALMETMAFGLPVVASNIRGTRDLIKNGIGGFLVNKYDTDGFAEKIQYILKNSELCSAMITYNKEYIKQFEIKQIMCDMKTIYEIN